MRNPALIRRDPTQRVILGGIGSCFKFFTEFGIGRHGTQLVTDPGGIPASGIDLLSAKGPVGQFVGKLCQPHLRPRDHIPYRPIDIERQRGARWTESLALSRVGSVKVRPTRRNPLIEIDLRQQIGSALPDGESGIW